MDTVLFLDNIGRNLMELLNVMDNTVHCFVMLVPNICVCGIMLGLGKVLSTCYKIFTRN